MSPLTAILDGTVRMNGELTTIKVKYGSVHSLFVTGIVPIRDVEIDELDVTMNGQTLNLGNCRFINDDSPKMGNWRVMPIAGILNFYELFSHSRIESLESSAQVISMSLDYKSNIAPLFREYVSDLTYDLNTYKKQLDRMDISCEEEPPEVCEAVRKRLVEVVGKTLMRYMDEKIERLHHHIKDFSESEHKHHGFYFRSQLWNFLLCAPIMARTNLKPRGYAGDSEMMTMIYQNDYAGSSSFGSILHKHAINRLAAQAVRYRRGYLVNAIQSHLCLVTRSPSSEAKILSVACGPFFEVANLILSKVDASRMHFSLLDQDPEALRNAKEQIEKVEKDLGIQISVDYVKESVRTMMAADSLKERWGTFQFIYSLGLFDYLTAPTASAVLRKFYQLLRPGGELVIGNFSLFNIDRYYMEYWLDWNLLLRSEDDMMKLSEGLPGAHTYIQFDPLKIQMFLHVHKSSNS